MERGWLTQNAIPPRRIVAISLPDDEEWRAQFLGALLLLTGAENWELFGDLTPDEMAAEWLDIFVNFIGGQTTMIPIGTVLEFGGDVLPDDFLWADGANVSRETFSQLFAVYGTKFGAGNGSTTFGLPNRNGRVGIGRNPSDTDFDTVGDIYGEKNVTLTTAQIPAHSHGNTPHTHAQPPHNHNQNPHSHGGDGFVLDDNLNTGISAFASLANGRAAFVHSQATAVTLQATAVNDTTMISIANTGGGGSHNNIPPSLVMNYIIKYK